MHHVSITPNVYYLRALVSLSLKTDWLEVNEAVRKSHM